MKIQVADGHKTAEGYYVGRARVTGESVLDYTAIYGVHIYRPLAEIAKPESANTLALQPISFSHPAGSVDSTTATEVTIGWTGEDWEIDETGALVINFKIVADWAVALIEQALAAGQRVQFSIGADAKPHFEPGVFKGQAYEVWLSDIVYNHLALLIGEEGRYPHTQIITDSEAADRPWVVLWDAQILPVEPNKPEETTVKITLPSGFEIEVKDAEAHHVTGLVNEHKQLLTDHAEQKGELTQARKDLTAATANLLDSKGITSMLTKRKALAVEAAAFIDSADPIDLMVLDDAGIYEAALKANGYTAEELAAEKAELKDSYGAFLKAAYRSIKKAGADSESAEILTTADSTKTPADKQPANDPNVIVFDSAAGPKTLRERMDKRAKGAIA